MTTPHLNAADGAFADTVLMPGDPKRAERIADRFLESAECVSDVRGMRGYTGFFEGTRVSVMPSGMGMPSAAIYVTELVRFYGVKRVIRVGTAGVYDPDVRLRQVVAASEAVTNSSLPANIGASMPYLASTTLLETAKRVAADTGVDLIVGKALSSDVFYEPDDGPRLRHTADGVICAEMEAAAMYAICALEGADALAIMTMTDHLVHGDQLSADDRQTSVDEMLELGLRTAVAADE